MSSLERDICDFVDPTQVDPNLNNYIIIMVRTQSATVTVRLQKFKCWFQTNISYKQNKVSRSKDKSHIF